MEIIEIDRKNVRVLVTLKRAFTKESHAQVAKQVTDWIDHGKVAVISDDEMKIEVFNVVDVTLEDEEDVPVLPVPDAAWPFPVGRSYQTSSPSEESQVEPAWPFPTGKRE